MPAKILAMSLVIEVGSGIKAGDAVGGSLTVLPAPPSSGVGTELSNEGFDKGVISLLDTRGAGIGQGQTSKAKGHSDKEKAKENSFDERSQTPEWITSLDRGDGGHGRRGRRVSRAIGGDQGGPPSKNPAVGKVGTQDALAGRVSDQDDADS